MRDAVALLAILLCTMGTAAHSATIERLGNGRVVVKVLGEKLTFREKDAHRVQLFWPSYRCEPRPSAVTLALWLDDPKVAECIDQMVPTEFSPGSRLSVTFKIYLGYEDGSGYPGAGRKISQPLPSSLAIYPGGIGVVDLPVPPLLTGEVLVRVKSSYTGLECLSPVVGSPDDMGYEPHGPQKVPPFSVFTLPPDRRPGVASKPLCVSCSQVSAWKCSAMLRSTDKAVSLSLSWYDWDYRGPRPTWALYDAAARKIAAAIFIDRPDELQ
jgi:hypothetical protein